MLTETQSMVERTAHGKVDGGRSQGVAVADDILVTTDGGGANGSQVTDGEPMVQTAGTGD